MVESKGALQLPFDAVNCRKKRKCKKNEIVIICPRLKNNSLLQKSLKKKPNKKRKIL